MHKIIGDRAFIKKVLVVALPMMLQQLISMSVNLVDNLMVGTLGDAAIGSVAAVNKYYVIAIFAIQGLASAAAVFIAQYHGAEEPSKMRQSFRVLLISTVVIMSLFTIFSFAMPRAILNYFTKDEEVIKDGIAYLRIALWSFIPSGLIVSLYSSMRAVGVMKLPLRTSIISVLTNAFLNYCLILGNFGFPRLELIGAALATLLARLLEVVLAIIVLKRYEFPFKTNFSHLFHVTKSLWRDIISKATPLMLNEILWSFSMATVFKFYSTRGPEVMSGYSVSGTIGDLFFTLFSGMAAATTVLVSTSLGANRLEEAKRHAYQLIGFSTLLAVLFGVMMFGSTFLIPSLYPNLSSKAITVAKSYLYVQSCLFWIYMCTTQCYFILRAGGDMKHTLIMDSGFNWCVFIPIVAFLTYFTNINYLWLYIAGQSTELIKLVFAFYIIRKEEWVVNLTV